MPMQAIVVNVDVDVRSARARMTYAEYLEVLAIAREDEEWLARHN